MKIFIPVILFYGNKNVCLEIFIRILNFKNYFYRKVLCVFLGDGVKYVGFVYVLFESI